MNQFQQFINLKNIRKGWLTTIVGIALILLAFWRYDGSNVESTLTLVAVGFSLFFMPGSPGKDSGTAGGAVAGIVILLLLLSCGAKAPVVDLPEAKTIAPQDSAAGPVKTKRPWSLLSVNIYKDKSTTVHQNGNNNSTGKKAAPKTVEGDGNVVTDGQVKKSNQDKSKAKDNVAVEGDGNHIGKQKETSGLSPWWLLLVPLGFAGYFAYKNRKKLGSLL